MNIYSYIDGFNLYNGALKNTNYKWLNLQTFSECLRPKDTILKVKYFTARVKPRTDDPYQPARQSVYWRALRTVSTIEIIEGHFSRKATYLPEVQSVDHLEQQQQAGVNVLGIRPSMAHVYRSEEKGTDVNLATHLIHDAHLNRFDAAIVVSNDSDLTEAIRIVCTEIQKPVYVFYPHSRHPSMLLRNTATGFREIRSTYLRASQFSDTLTDLQNTLTKPTSW